ncbi:MAG: M15 family metallopeptidase [Lachnospiraceae bacterium]|nr:M15 family metallopeptidase [Lachnospiraceae bacterium]
MEKKIRLLALCISLLCFGVLIYSFYKEPAQTKEDGKEDTTEVVSEESVSEDKETTLREDEEVIFSSEEISDEVFERIYGISYGKDCTIPREDLRYLQITYVGFDEKDHVGEMICNKVIAEDLLDIFEKLYEARYEIEGMELVDNYNGDDEASMEANNSSCFNFRFIAGTTKISNHGKGMAVDINPLYNPYITSSGYTPVNAGEYVDRSRDFEHKIDENDLCYQLFIEHGFTWGGSWNSSKDYQHFEKEA